MLQLNLLPDVKKEYLRAQQIRNLVVTGCIVIVIAAGAAVLILSMILGGQALIKSDRENKIADFKAQIDDAKRKDNLDNYLTVQNQLASINELKKKQLVYTRLLDYLKQVNPDGISSVRLTSVTVDEGEVSISGETSSIRTLGLYLNTLKTAEITYYIDTEGEQMLETKKLFDFVGEPDFGASSDSEGPKVMTFTIRLRFTENAFSLDIKGDKEGNIDTVPVVTTPDDMPINGGQQLFKESCEC